MELFVVLTGIHLSSMQTPETDFVQLLPTLPDTVDPDTITLANSPSGGDSKHLRDIASFKLAQIGLK